ncbi:sensor histidine kinase [Ottowia thiooxydans]|uniref:histidine kinase n=1 Tax=Ottowia thiooxydans TaxID=219182 RepID=A0ABV2Q7Q3_9BURK
MFERSRTHLKRLGYSLRHSLRLRLVFLFLVLALAMTVVFLGGMQKALSGGWRDAARPLVADYIDRLVAEIGNPPSVERAEALVKRLPISLRIIGPQVNWQSEPDSRKDSWRQRRDWMNHEAQGIDGSDGNDSNAPLLRRTTADGHQIVFGLSATNWQHPSRRVGWFTLGLLLLLTAGAYAYVRRMLRPLDDIRAGAQRFGGGDFAEPIPVRRSDELGTLASDVNAMGQSIHQMLQSQRGLLLAISHELRSPLTRARINTELLPESVDTQPLREALLRDLAAMRDLISDLLESERLGLGHAALHLESTDLAELVRDVVAKIQLHANAATNVAMHLEGGLADAMLDRTRTRLLVNNLITNALQHSADAPFPPEIYLRAEAETGAVRLVVRDHGPGVPEAVLPHLAEPFYRPDAARERATGGVGLGLYLCKLVVLAHGGSWHVRNAGPGLEVSVSLPVRQTRDPQ